MCLCFLQLFFLVIDSLISLWSEKMLVTISVFLNFLSLVCDPRCGLSWRMFHVHLRRRCILLLGWNVLKISMRSIPCNVSFKNCVSLLIFCLDDLSIGGVVGVLKSPTIIVLKFLLLCLLVFILCTEVLLCWMHRYLQLLCLSLGLIP